MPQNNTENAHTTPSAIWIFGYGSLIWRPGFDYAERTRAELPDWSRRFWQASTDHRGVPEAPGRVVTLVREPGAVCTGIAYRLDDNIDATMTYLDEREQGGYVRQSVSVQLAGHGKSSVAALTYIADENDCLFVGPESEQEITETVSRAAGPSGSNREYCLQLALALREENIVDRHIEKISSLLGQTPSVNRV